MATHEEHHIIDAAGNRVAVVLDIEDYHRLLAALEDLDDRRSYDEAAAANDEAAPLEEALAEIERPDLAAYWADVDRLAAEIGARWPAGVSASDAVARGRREL